LEAKEKEKKKKKTWAAASRMISRKGENNS
jgi:hypothetical protein